jgi:NAD(P)-dependent dehydrogenase (short-subunit alcohol dehydrogenase family)
VNTSRGKPMDEFKDRVAVVTGAASGIGLATSTRFAQAGMKVVMADIQEDALATAVSDLAGAGHEVTGVATDVTSYEQIEALADKALGAYGKVNVIHNNAGVVRAGRLEDLTLEDWEWVLGVDLWSVIYGVKVFLPLIKEAGEGHVVNTASSAGLQSTVNIGPYNVAKFGVVALTETLQLELEEDESPIGASVLCPGAVATQICASGRNRERAGFSAGEASEADETFSDLAGAIVDAGLPPSAVAEQVLDAVTNKHFWIVTHPDWIDVVQERVGGMRKQELVTGFGG